MNICIVATICKETGALSIYNQLMFHLIEEQKAGEHYYIFIEPSMPMHALKDAHYIKYSTNGIKNRLKFDKKDFRKKCNELGIKPDVILSLNNSGVKYKGVRQYVYYHQSIPLYDYKVNSLNKASLIFRFYQKILPLYIKKSLTKDTLVIVQTNLMRNLFAKKYKFPLEKIFVAFPDIKQVNGESIAPYSFNDNCFHFIYPATKGIYKEHFVLVKALDLIQESLRSRIRIHFTLSKDDKPILKNLIDKAGLSQHFIFHGSIPHNELLSMYKASHGLLFPSRIETIGLPLLEAASFGIPIIANDINFVHEVLKNYDGLKTVPVHDYKQWSEDIIQLCKPVTRYKEYSLDRRSDWNAIINMMKEEQSKQ